MLVIVNPTAGGGRAVERWVAIEARFRKLAARWSPTSGPVRVEAPASRDEAGRAIRRALVAGERCFVAAGGDGSVNALLSALADDSGRVPEDDGLLLGAVGLGSSNDFHKPFADRRTLDDIPVRIDSSSAVAHDVGVVRYRDGEGRPHARPWIVNASVGLTADANAFFNEPDALLRALKGTATASALAYAALRTLATAPVHTLGIRIDGSEESWLPVSNLGIVKNPHFAGCLRYDSPHDPGDGSFYVHLLEGTGRAGRLATLSGLARGRFTGRPGTRSSRASELVVRGREPFVLETDGEVALARSAVFTLSPARIRVCG